MKKFRVLLRGENFLLKSEESVKRLGFYTTRFVEAPDKDGAEKCAVESIRKDDRLQECVLNDQSDPPMLFAEEIDEISSFETGKDQSLGGYTFYDDDATTH